MTKIRKSTSKRITARKKYSVLKKVADHKRKLKKEIRKMKTGGVQKPIPKPVGIPNAFPGKAEMLEEYEHSEKRKEESAKSEKAMKKAMKDLPGGIVQNFPEQINVKVISAQEDEDIKMTDAQLAEAERLMTVTGEIDEKLIPKDFGLSRRAYYKELTKVIEESDVVLQVLDARDPEATRSEEIEREAVKNGKRLIQVLNKIDLVPMTEVKKWQRHLGSEFPCVIIEAQFKHKGAQTNASREKNLKRKEKHGGGGIKEAEDQQQLMSDSLTKVLHKAFKAIKSDEKTVLTVGVVGYPNVGKSSLVNLLKHSNASIVSPMPGTTKTTQEVEMDKKVVLLDAPGVIPKGEEDKDGLILRQAIKVTDQFEEFDAVGTVSDLLNKVEMNEVCKLYHIAQYKSSVDMLALLAKKKAALRAGGVAGIDDAARIVLRDFMAGKLKYFTPCPKATIADSDSN